MNNEQLTMNDERLTMNNIRRAALFVFLMLLLIGCGGKDALAPVPTVELAAVQPTAVPPIPTSTPKLLPTAVPTMPPPPTLTPIPVAEESETKTAATPTDTPPIPAPTAEPMLNGIPLSQILLMDDAAVAHMQEIYALGQTLGRDPNSFSKLGDSIIANGDFLTRYDVPGSYNLGPYEYLQPAIDHFPGSWDRYGVGIKIGLRAWGVFDPQWADKEWCEPNETMIDCEIRYNNPSIMIIHLGSNDQDPSFDTYYREVIQYTLDQGIVPLLLTKADRFEGEDNFNNNAIRQTAVDLQVPLVDFDLLAATLPNRGIKEGDNVHLNGPLVHDYTLDDVYTKGHSMHNLTIIMMIDRIWKEVCK